MTKIMRKNLLKIVICLLLGVIGIGGFKSLQSMKQPPVQVKKQEPKVPVEAMAITFQNVESSLAGFGTAHALNKVAITPEVSGMIVALHDCLEVGECIQAGEVLFKIDPRDYQASVAQARAAKESTEAQLEQLQRSETSDRKRLQTLVRSRDLAEREWQRVKDLFEKNQVGSQSRVDQSEQAYNTAVDALDRLSLATALYPARIREVQASLARAEAQLALAETRLQRCTVTAPFTARLEAVRLEAGQVVSPGSPVLTLADDSLLEIKVPLDGREVRQWLSFTEGSRATAWFDDVEPVDCRIFWTEDPERGSWAGRLHRIVRVKNETRTVTAAIRIPADQARHAGRGLPLVEGMFCRVEIPGRPLEGVARLPQHAVTLSNQVYVAQKDPKAQWRLGTVDVTVARKEGDHAYVSKGLLPGQTVITTRLVDPLEGTLLELPEVLADRPSTETDSLAMALTQR